MRIISFYFAKIKKKSIIYNYTYRKKKKQTKTDLHNSKQFNKKHKTLHITKADKGNTTVVIEKTVYLDEMNSLLRNEHYCKKLKSHPSSPSSERNC